MQTERFSYGTDDGDLRYLFYRSDQGSRARPACRESAHCPILLRKLRYRMTGMSGAHAHVGDRSSPPRMTTTTKGVQLPLRQSPAPCSPCSHSAGPHVAVAAGLGLGASRLASHREIDPLGPWRRNATGAVPVVYTMGLQKAGTTLMAAALAATLTTGYNPGHMG